MSVVVKYKNGLPTKKCVRELISAFFSDTLYAPRVNDAYVYTGCVVWDRTVVNDKIDAFASYLNDSGVEVTDYQLYDSPTVGHLKFKKQTKS